mgnify:CR=1 FL=1
MILNFGKRNCEMIFRKRLYFYSIGLIIGIFLVMFIFRGKNATFNYMPNARVIDNIISKDSIQFLNEETNSFKIYDIKEIILNGKIDCIVDFLEIYPSLSSSPRIPT